MSGLLAPSQVCRTSSSQFETCVKHTCSFAVFRQALAALESAQNGIQQPARCRFRRYLMPFYFKRFSEVSGAIRLLFQAAPKGRSLR
eukprot:7104379-Alexandrium_andersonii.AAC.1